ncbi:MAG: hypothetical protein C3F13_16650 [Anaerolineales bacterium]|nr:MAG: hypothetical protein C3F13_16650 [Anaerolineales bacterium]
MTVFISLLQGINVGGQKRLGMEALRKIYQDLGFSLIRTYVQSGNVAFSTDEENCALLKDKIEVAITRACGFSTRVFIRTAGDLQRILNSNPFLTKRMEEASKLHISFLYQPVESSAWSRLSVPQGSQDEYAPGKMEVFLFCPNGYGKTKLSNSFFERKLGVPVTTRNWNTLEALYRMAQDVP